MTFIRLRRGWSEPGVEGARARVYETYLQALCGLLGHEWKEDGYDLDLQSGRVDRVMRTCTRCGSVESSAGASEDPERAVQVLYALFAYEAALVERGSDELAAELRL